MFPSPEIQGTWPESDIGLILIDSMMAEVDCRSSEGGNELILIKNTAASSAGH